VASSPWSGARRATASALVILGCALSAAVTGVLVGRTTQSVAGDRNAPWIVGRAAGLSAYMLLVLLVAMGLVLSHPGRTRIRRPSSATRIRLHVSLAVFTLVLIVLHVVVLATDSYAGVGWRGSFVPLGSSYRPVPVTLGVLGLYAGLLAGVTAAVSGRRLIARIWWPIHKVAVVSFLLVWAHGLYAGIDTEALLWLYLVTGIGLVALAVWRYTAQTPADLVRDLSDSPETTVRRSLRAVEADSPTQSAR
jgi:hypothetical protein